MKTAIVFLADGLEMCEGLLVVDILRRAGVNVITASIMGKSVVTSSHNVQIKADVLAEDVDFAAADMVVLPGGKVGTAHLKENELVRAACRSMAEAGKWVAAVCAAPSVLADLGLLEGKHATCHPVFEGQMRGAVLTGESVTVDGNFVTGQGLGASLLFALQLAELLTDEATADKIAESICF